MDRVASGGAKRLRNEDETEYIQELHDNNVVDDVHSTLPLMACVILDVSSSQPRMDSPMVGPSIVFQTLGRTQLTPDAGTNDKNLLDQSSLSYTSQEYQNNILVMTLTGSLDESHVSSSPSSAGSIINLAFLDATNGHCTPAPTQLADQYLVEC